MASIKDAVRIFKIVHGLLHFEGEAPQGGETDEGTVLLCHKVQPWRLAYLDVDNQIRQQYGGIYELAAVGEDPIAACELWIREKLRGSSALALEVASRINPGPLNPGTQLPAVSFAMVGASTVSGADGVIAYEGGTWRVCVEA